MPVTGEPVPAPAELPARILPADLMQTGASAVVSPWRDSGHPEKAGLESRQAPGTGAPLTIWDELRAEQHRIRQRMEEIRDEMISAIQAEIAAVRAGKPHPDAEAGAGDGQLADPAAPA